MPSLLYHCFGILSIICNTSDIANNNIEKIDVIHYNVNIRNQYGDGGAAWQKRLRLLRNMTAAVDTEPCHVRLRILQRQGYHLAAALQS